MRQMGFALLAGFIATLLHAADEPYGSIADLKLAKPEDREDVKGTPPPSGAIALFDGTSLDGWVKQNGKDSPHWKIVDSGVMQVEKGGNLITKKTFDGHFKLHVEFRVP